MAEQLSVELRNNALNQITVTLGNGGLLRIFDNSAGKPLTTAAPSLGVLLIQFVCASPLAPFPVNGVLTPTKPAQVNALAAGTALYYRLFKNDGVSCVWQNDVTAVNPGMVLNPSNNVIVAGLPEVVDSWTIVLGGA